MTKFKSDEESPDQQKIAIKRNANSQAFSDPQSSEYTGATGLSKREYMATQILAGMLANGSSSPVYGQRAVEAADILLSILARTEVGQRFEESEFLKRADLR